MECGKSPTAVLANPYFFPLDFDLEGNQSVFVNAGWEDFCARLRLSALDFPIERLRLVGSEDVIAAGRLLSDGCNLNFLFHMPFSGSSLLTRLLEVPDILPVRDPACIDALFQSVGGEEGVRMPMLRTALLRLLNRPVPGRVLLIRTAGYHPSMFAPLSGAPECRSVLFLFERIETFLLQVLKSDRRRADLRLLLDRAPQEVARRTGRRPGEFCDAEIATVFWVSAAEAFLKLAHPYARSVESGDLFERPAATAGAVARFIGADPARTLRLDPDAVRAHAKTGQPFDPASRAAGLVELRARHGAELSRAAPLAESLCAPALEAALRRKALR